MPRALWIPAPSGPLPRVLSNCGKKGHKGSAPSWSHPPQITIYTRRLRAGPSRWEEKPKKMAELGKNSAGAALGWWC